LVQKLQWSPDEAWNPDRYDLEHLTAFIGDKLGEATAWQVVPFAAPMDEWLAAPLLYMQGHDFPIWNEAQRTKVRTYIEQGGTLLVEACCSRKDFHEGFTEFVRQTFPQQPLHELDPGHPVYKAHYDLPAQGVHGVDVGCRTSIIYLPRDVSCLWEQARVPVLSENAFKLGTNLAAYAAGAQGLRDRLDIQTLPAAAQAAAGAPTSDALRLAQVVYDGDWRPDPQALVRFAEFLHAQAGLDVITEYRPVRLRIDELATSPLLFLTGHYAFTLSPAETSALAEHLRRGGFLLAEACCGREAFDSSLRSVVAEMFGPDALRELPAGHDIYRGRPGFNLPAVAYKPAALARDPDLRAPQLWGVELDGRLALVYSPFSLGCSMDGHVCHDCLGVEGQDASKLGANIVLYALTH
jgi:hypothetical protein